MSTSTGAALTSYLIDAARVLGSRYLTVYFQGGEPLLQKKFRFEEIVSGLQAAAAAASVELCLSIQTNAILVDDEWIGLFSRFGIHVAVSLDGPETINDAYRVDHRGRGTYRRTMVGLQRLMDAHKDGRLKTSPTILAVIQPEMDAAAVFRHFVDDVGVRDLHYQLPDASRNSVLKPSALKLNTYLHELFLAWAATPKGTVRVRLFSDAIRRLTWTSDKGESNVAISISSDGHVGPPDDWRNHVFNLFDLGLTVRNSTIREYLDDPQVARADAEISSLPVDCKGCVWRDACRGGNIANPLHRHDSRRGFEGNSVYCVVLQTVFLDCLEHLLRSGVSSRQLCESLAV
jgi:uncharacterized protein